MRPPFALARRGAVVVLALAALPVATADALPEDPPIAALEPADGAEVSTSDAGLPVTFTCAVYRQLDLGTGFVIFGGPRDHAARMATEPTLGTDGRLRDDVVVAQAQASEPNTLPEGQCQVVFAGRPPDAPNLTPGTYWWQANRLCSGCPAGYETGPVRRLVVRASARLTLRAPATPAWGGFAAALRIAAPGVPDGTAVAIERLRGTTWRRLTTTRALGGAAEAIAVLPTGRLPLRATVRLGTDTVASPTRTITVRAPRAWTTGAGDVGPYRGTSVGAHSVALAVTAAGRTLRDFTALVPMLCPGLEAGQTTTQIGRALVRRARIAPDGRFLTALVPARETAISLRGRVAHGRVVDGLVTLSVGTCTGSLRFAAARQRPR